MSDDLSKKPPLPNVLPTLDQRAHSKPFVPTLPYAPNTQPTLPGQPTFHSATMLPDGDTLTDLPSAKPNDHAQHVPSQVAGRYDLLQALGEGGMGRVYKAHDRVLDEPVAIKILHPSLALSSSAVQLFHQEVKLARRVTHPNVARTFDLGQDGDLLFLTMEYVSGPSLRTHLQRNGPLPIKKTVSALRGICSGLAAAHKQGIIHRDLKPENLIVTRSGRIVILDFGIAASKDQHNRGEFAGTLSYMAPEQLNRERIGTWTDMYALGCIAFEMFTGTMAWDVGNDLSRAMLKTSQSPPDPLLYRQNLPVSVAHVVQRAMEPSSAQRIPTAVAFRDALKNAFGDQHVSDARSRHTPVPSATSAHHTPQPSFKTLAVLPFLGPREDETIALAEGVTEDLIDALSTLPSVRVRPWGAIARFNDPERNLQSVGRELSVSTVVDASLRRVGDRIRIRVRLFNVADGFQTQAHKFDCGVSEALNIGQDIADTLAESLHLRTSPPETVQTPEPQAPPDSALLFLRARHMLRTHWYGNMDDLTAAVELFDHALSLAPNDPRVLAGTAKAYARLSFGSGADNLSYAFDLVQRALDLDPNRGESWFILGLCRFHADEHAQAIEALHKALRFSPDDDAIHELMGRTLLESDGPEIAIRYLERAQKLNPYNLNLRWDLIRAWAFMRRWDRVDALLALPVTNPQTAVVHNFSAVRFALWHLYTHPEEHVSIPNRTSFGVRDDTLGYLIELYIYVAKNRTIPSDFHDKFETFLVSGQGSPRIFHVTLQFAVELCMASNQEELAYGFLLRAIQAGLSDRVWMARCPMLEGFQDHPEIRAFLAS